MLSTTNWVMRPNSPDPYSSHRGCACTNQIESNPRSCRKLTDYAQGCKPRRLLHPPTSPASYVPLRVRAAPTVLSWCSQDLGFQLDDQSFHIHRMAGPNFSGKRIGPQKLAVFAIKDIEETVLGRLGSTLRISPSTSMSARAMSCTRYNPSCRAGRSLVVPLHSTRVGI